ncbi:MAG: UPF0280 family protein [Thermodesulfobacteriota bacterium]|nr:UPF0280 family protein [Thermodesulfobacteriota bacterium]
MLPHEYQKRFYRSWISAPGLVVFQVQVKETDLHIQAESLLTGETEELVLSYRHQLESYIVKHPDFFTSLVPVPQDILAPPIVREMIEAGQRAGVGPMAAVAGAIAGRVGRDLLDRGKTGEIIVENGGDIFVATRSEARIGIFAGGSPLSGKVGIAVPAGQMPVGACTSSGTVGHSLSFGKADAVTVVAGCTALADAAATAVGNVVKGKRDIDRGLSLAKDIGEISGVVIIAGDKIGAWGDIELISLE